MMKAVGKSEGEGEGERMILWDATLFVDAKMYMYRMYSTSASINGDRTGG